jgi:hypothetical protein
LTPELILVFLEVSAPHKVTQTLQTHSVPVNLDGLEKHARLMQQFNVLHPDQALNARVWENVPWTQDYQQIHPTSVTAQMV